MTDGELKEILAAILIVLKDYRAHVVVVKKLLREKDLLSQEDYNRLHEQALTGLEQQDQEILELNRLLGLDPDVSS